MCGILGGWCEEPIDGASLDAALDAMDHRGPDDVGKFRHGSAFLAMRRLAIIDLAGGKQPLFNEDRNLAVVCNGEIYNYRELTRDLKTRGHRFTTQSDTEVLLHLYEEHGADLCRHLRGMYGFALWDARRRRLLLGRDRFGKKPLYYARTPSAGLLFATELKALRPLLQTVGGQWELRHQAIYDYLSVGCVPQPETAFDGVSTVPPASTLSFDGNEIDLRRYWTLDFQPKQKLAYREAVEQTRQQIREAVHLRLRSDVPLGVFLSGGVDSSVVAYEAAQEVGENLRTFTVAVEDAQFDESPTAARTARSLGVENTVLPLTFAPLKMLQTVARQYDQPFGDPSAIPSLAVSQLARQHVTVVLNGDGGDEVFAGYRRHLAAYLAQSLARFPSPVTSLGAKLLGATARERRSTAGFAARLLRGLKLSPAARYLTWTSDRMQEADKRSIWCGDAVRPTEEWLTSLIPTQLSWLDTQIATDVQVNLLSQLLVKMDIATMAHSLEGRSPFLDHVLAEFVAALPDAFRLHGRQTKGLLRDAYRELLPREVTTGKKRGFEIPLKSWLENELHELLQDTLGSRSAQVRTFLDGRFVDRLLQQQALGDRNWATLVYSLLVLEVWLEEFAASREKGRSLRTAA